MRRISKFTSIVLLFTAFGFSSFRLIQSHDRYVRTTKGLAQCTVCAEEIKSLRQRPDRAARQSRSTRALAKTIEESATHSGLKPSQIVSIEPQGLRRLQETDYEQHTTVVRVEAVTLEELARLAARLKIVSEGRQPLRVAGLRVSTPYQTTGGLEEVWNVELTLTYLVFSPKNQAI